MLFTERRSDVAVLSLRLLLLYQRHCLNALNIDMIESNHHKLTWLRLMDSFGQQMGSKKDSILLASLVEDRLPTSGGASHAENKPLGGLRQSALLINREVGRD
ncbi:hypothetical protein DM02DRAFT_141180 [Periconia macrospinosa]|uniref:Uncharacterized protein n=1 Tax=Periconia macrospinosa TaxID=97972 RepID=A0A2V1DC81_9PLEO|nr:hypothetical protein DM02DRAFT_141180 [Periconia macrospinosa]